MATFRNVLSNELKESFTLAGSEKHDVITCSLVTDLQMDHQPTILLGTYGQELLAYRFVNESWCLSWQKSFSHPILALDYCDVTGDGVRELVALTTRGVQILQVNFQINSTNFDKIIFEGIFGYFQFSTKILKNYSRNLKNSLGF